MSRFSWPLVIFIGLLALLIVGLGLNPRNVPSPLIGQSAPVFSLPDLFDEQMRVNSISMNGKPWLLNVWGSWCPECWREHGFLIELSNRQVIPIVGLNWKDEPAGAKQMLRQNGNPFTVVAMDQRGDVAIDWGVYGAPETFLIDAQGIVRYKHTGAMTPIIWEQAFVPLL